MATMKSIIGDEIQVAEPTQELADLGYVPVKDYNNLSSETLTPEPKLNYSTYQEPSVYNLSGLNLSPEMQMTAPEQEAQGFTERLQQLNTQLLGESGFTSQQEQAQNLPGLVQTQKDLEARLNILKNENASIPLLMQQQAEGRGITAGGLRPLETARLRENAIQALSTASMLEASRGNIATAQTLVDRAVAQKYGPIKEQIDVLTKNLQLIKDSPAYSLADKNRAQKQLEIQEAKKAEIAKQEENERAILGVATEAAKFGVDAATLEKIRNAKDLTEATQIAQQAGMFAPAKEGLMTLSPGQSIYDPNTGEILGTAPDKPLSPKDSIQAVGDTLLQYNAQTGGWETIYAKPKGTTADDLSVNERLSLAEKGYELDENGNLIRTNVTSQEKIDKSNRVITAVNDILGINWQGVVGAVQGKKPEFVMSGEQITAKRKIDQLTGLLTLDNMGIMKGVLSDADIKIITSASTSLHRAMDEGSFLKELENIKHVAKSVLNSDKLEIGQILDNGDGTYSYKNLDGTTRTGNFGDNYRDTTIPKLDLDFSGVGGDTNEAASKAVSVSDGSKGGQCGRFVNQHTGLGLGDSYESKMSKMDKSISRPEPGMVFVMPYGSTGHTGFIVGVKGDKVVVKDSNWSKDEKVKTHEIPISKITGLRRV
jgi:hypothetical protein